MVDSGLLQVADGGLFTTIPEINSFSRSAFFYLILLVNCASYFIIIMIV